MPDLADQAPDFDAIYSKIAQDILNGDSPDINTDLYFKTAKTLMNGAYNGLGGSALAYDDERAVLANYLQNNIYYFSAAKSLAEMIHFRELMIGKDGKIVEPAAFKKAVADQGYVFNNTHLMAEVNHARQSAIMAHKWETLNCDYLEFSTVGDNRVRPSHAKLNKFTALKSDPIWRKLYTPLDWGCRCNIVPGKAQNVANNPMTDVEAGKMIKPEIKDTIFDNNVGISKVIFNDNHPYFKNAKGEIHSLSWQQYGLPSLEKIRVNPLPEYKGMSQKEYADWWKGQPKWKGDDIVFKDVLNQHVLLSSGEGKSGKLDDYYKNHITKKDKEERWSFAAESKNVITDPDEVWHNKQGRVYIKYYEQGTLKLVANDELEAKTIFQLHDKDSGELTNSRRGTLLYKK